MRADNRIVHSLWIGSYLTRLELLTLSSFVEHGHSFHLWVYGPLAQELPNGVVLRDATEIIPFEQVFRKRSEDSETGLGSGSYATFSDIFRAKLLFAHGGIWVDMDVLCLRPLDFTAPYVFRAHRVGVVMNLMKCPQGSQVMGTLIEQAGNQVNAESEWLGFTRTLYFIIREIGLESYIRADLMPPDCWESVQPFVEGDGVFDPTWYAIHWINELWTTLRKTLGSYRGLQLTNQLPDKNHPLPCSTLHRLYDRYGLLRSGWTPCAPPVIPENRLAARQPLQLKSRPPHVNIAVPSMALGGAERAIQEIVIGLSRVGGTSNIFVFHQVIPSYSLDVPGCTVISLAGMDEAARMEIVVAKVLASPVPALYSHLNKIKEFAPLARLGIAVVPVVQNSMPSWQDYPRAYDRDGLPFVIAVSEAIKRELMDLRCPRPVIALRHELQRAMPSPEAALAAREELRARHGIPRDVLLIGMVGQFKAQKAYTRAIDILRGVQEHLPAQLIILGGWGQTWGAGRACHTAVCRPALDAHVLADVILPGSVHAVDPYYVAFDVYLSTSYYEGLSVSLLEAIAYGCPVVCTNAGGAAEVVTAQDEVIDDGRDIGAFVNAIVRAAGIRERRLHQLRTDSFLVPGLWSALGRIAAGSGIRPQDGQGRALFLTENLNIGGPQRSLLKLLHAWPHERKPVIGVLDSIYGDGRLEEAQATGAQIFGLASMDGLPTSFAESVIDLVDAMGIDRIVFWNVPVNVKFILGKLFEAQKIRLIDVSPGPMWMNELMEQDEFSRRITFSDNAYFERLDCFVSKYRNGVPDQIRRQGPEKYRIVPNGVATEALAGPVATIPGVDLRHLIGTCTRIVPSKRIEYLVDMMDWLTPRLPTANLVIVGGVDPRYRKYAQHISDKIARAGLSNIHFVGPQRDVGAYLRAFKVFAMISEDQGCPNASLEAMAHGLPVVANPSGGVEEQVEDGVNGYCVSGENPIEMAQAIEKLLRDPQLARKFGQAGRRIAQERFSMERMVEGYLEVCS